ncbi:MAG: phosphoenolpyruvate carboxykinase (ATP) [Pseudomonadota bacterium]
MGANRSLEPIGLHNVANVYWNSTTAQLYEEIVRRREGWVGHLGPIVVRTGSRTGRSPKDKFIVKEQESEKLVWWGPENKPFVSEKFESLYRRMTAYLQGRDLFIQDCHAGADNDFRIPIRVITENAWQSLFARNMFRQIHDPGERLEHKPAFTLVSVPNFQAIPELDGTNSEAFVIISFKRKLILIGGASYAGEIKKSVFTILNFLLPSQNVLSMHCSANVGEAGDAAIFFGLSGTGKTTLSADPKRKLLGDDEHGWSEKGLFNFEGGCYAKTINLSKEAEPEIYAATRRFGTVLENVGFDENTRRVDLDDNSLTENTRAAYPISHIDNAIREGVCGHPKNILMLTCDAFGVLPPLSRLSPEQARYHFLSGYTAKVAGTERGVSEPKATFSACFGAPFMALAPTVYSKLLGEKVKKHNVRCWLVNTGWVGGPYGVGSRISIGNTRAMVNAVLNGKLEDVPMREDKYFSFSVPKTCPGVSPELLDPENTWTDKEAYRSKMLELAKRFDENFKQFRDEAPPEVVAAGPKVGR